MKLVNATDPTTFIKKADIIQPYISIKPTGKTASVLDRFGKSVKFLPGALPRHELHITVMYATNQAEVDRIKYVLKPAIEWIVVPKEMTIFSNPDDQSCHLVMEIECPRLKEYNTYIRNIIGLKSSFSEYKPHITFASNPHKSESHSPAHVKGVKDFSEALDVYEAAKDEMNAALQEARPELFFVNMRFEEARS